VALRAFTRRASAGTHALRFSGRLGGRPLPPGRYELVASVTGPLTPGRFEQFVPTSLTAPFTIVK
jgi:hypothetical protein